jgi:hypothetical protein
MVRTGPDPFKSGWVSSRSWMGPEQVSAWSWAGVGRACCFENEMFKVGKWFMVLKIVNHFSKIKEEFSVKMKIFYVDHYFTLQ